MKSHRPQARQRQPRLYKPWRRHGRTPLQSWIMRMQIQRQWGLRIGQTKRRPRSWQTWFWLRAGLLEEIPF